MINKYKMIVMDFNKYHRYFYSYPTIDFGTVCYYVKKDYTFINSHDMEDNYVR